ncbi:MAG: putative manganese-dependent inorganic diphosphatase [Coriobacteriales bacterium]|nr:putative manganese-dependent inorganic diphosphatase [Coriobacteriales bacterium]
MISKPTVLVLGHRNPDNDSIAAATAYAYLKNAIDPSRNYVPARLGPMPKESAWVFETYGVSAPLAVPHVRNRARDVMTTPVVSIHKGTTMLEAARLFRLTGVSALVALDQQERFCGIVTLNDLAFFYIDQVEGELGTGGKGAGLAAMQTSVDAIVDAGVDTCKPDDLLSEVSKFVLIPPYREAIVLDDDRHCLGIITRGDVARAGKREVILVDHNESSQSAPGIEEAVVREIVDHHRVGDIQTSGPIFFMNLPYGSTATIVAQRYEVCGVPIPKDMAAVMLSAIMTDTLLLRSPTTTPVDRDMASKLAAIVGMDALEFGARVFRSRGGDEHTKTADIIGRDAKEYRFGDHLVVVAQYETSDLQSILARSQEIMEAMEQKVEARNYDTLLLLVTDVVAEGSQFLCAGDKRIVERAFGIDLSQGSVWMPGILSRKKQVAQRLIDNA